MTKITNQAFANFYKNKTIMRNFLFMVDVQSLYSTNSNYLYEKFKTYTSKFLKSSAAEGFILQPNLVKNVSVPDFSFNKQTVKHGPMTKAAPVLDFDGYELKLDLEEDEVGSVKQFIEHCQSRNVHEDGLYWPPSFAEIPSIKIKVLDGTITSNDEARSVVEFTYNNCIFLNASEITLDHGSPESIKYSLTFSSTDMQTEYK